jgi:hypothetical protein
MREYLGEILDDFDEAKDQVALISKAISHKELRRDYRNFLYAWHRCVEKLLDALRGRPDHRSFRDKVFAAVNQQDEGAMYLWEARNKADHVLGGIGQLRSARVEIGPGFTVYGDGPFKDNGIVFQQDGNRALLSGRRTIAMKDGVIQSVSGEDALGALQHRAELSLIPLQPKDKKKRLVQVPSRIGGKQIAPGDPFQLAVIGLALLDRWVKEFVERVKL